jgi:hypothetical protein
MVVFFSVIPFYLQSVLGRTFVRAKYDYPKGSPKNQQLKKESAATALNTVFASVHARMT